MFVDSEGEPIQELSCIAFSPKHRKIVAVYHKYAACDPFADAWSRLHVHGLDTSYIGKCGMNDEQTLVNDFKRWLQQFDIDIIYANDARREIVKFNLHITDISLPPWIERVKHRYHEIPQTYKNFSKPFCNIVCDDKVHSYFCFKRFKAL